MTLHDKQLEDYTVGAFLEKDTSHVCSTGQQCTPFTCRLTRLGSHLVPVMRNVALLIIILELDNDVHCSRISLQYERDR